MWLQIIAEGRLDRSVPHKHCIKVDANSTSAPKHKDTALLTGFSVSVPAGAMRVVLAGSNNWKVSDGYGDIHSELNPL